jgi:protein-disulfide isomerase
MRIVKAALAAGFLISQPALAAEVAKSLPGDHAVGEAKAPVTIIAYSSFACDQCANFHARLLPMIEKDYKEKVRVVFRDFPNSANALHAALVASCVPEKDYQKTAQSLYESQKSWAMEPAFIPGLKNVAAAAGLKKDAFYACMENKESATRMVNQSKEAAQKFGVRGVPAYFVQGERVERFLDAADVKKALDSAVAGKSANAPFEAEMKAAAQATPDDLVIGKADAPVSILEYASLSCPHCAQFHNSVLPELKKTLIDKGKAKLIFRHFPLNEPALKGAMLVQCAEQDKRADLLAALFSEQQQWAFGEDFQAKLKPIAARFGVKEKAFTACMANKEVEAKVAETRMKGAQVMNVQSTPSFYINGKEGEHLHSVAEFQQAIDAAGKEPQLQPASR